MTLEGTDLRTLCEELNDAAAKWRRIGLQLQVESGTLETFVGKESTEALIDMLNYALRNLEIKWEDIAKAMEASTVGRKDLAKKIRDKYCPTLKLLCDSKDNGDLGPPASKKPRVQSSFHHYQMNSPPDPSSGASSTTPHHGRALIINIDKYDDPEKYSHREGSDKDRDELEKTLTEMGYLVEVAENLNGGDAIVQKVFAHANDSENQSCDSFICCILAHGHEDVIIGKDGTPTEVRDISFKLAEVRHLREKPKIFFIQACQGNTISTPMRLDSGELDTEVYSLDVSFPTLPRESDFFWGLSTTYTNPSIRNIEEGSLYIQNLCEVLNEYYTREDLVTMVTRVHSRVPARSYEVKIKGKDGSSVTRTCQQQPQLVSNLRAPVHFN